MTTFKICSETTCNYVYQPDSTGLCPKCGSEGIWLNNTVLGDKETRNVLEGYWPKDDLRRAFVAGASWWEWHKEKATMWQSDRNRAEEEAESRYPEGRVRDALSITKEMQITNRGDKE